MLSNGDYVPASQLKAGDYLKTINGKKARITKITDVVLDSPVKVYNLDTENYDDFILPGGVVVHNSDVPERIAILEKEGQQPTPITYDYLTKEMSIDHDSAVLMMEGANPELIGEYRTLFEELIRGKVLGDGTFIPSIHPDDALKIVQGAKSELESIARGLDKQGGNELRALYLAKLRTMRGSPPPRYEGFVLESVLAENIEAFNQLRNLMKQNPPDIIFAFERGGVYIGEVLTRGQFEGILVKLSKSADPKVNPNELISAITNAINSGKKRIAISDSYMGGTTSDSYIR